MDTEQLKNVRVIAHIDLDAFYAQVEQNLNKRLGESVAVIQYNPFGDLKTYTEKDERVKNGSNGSIIAISYGECRRVGVKRGMRGGDARKLCPSLQLVQVPTLNGKADLTLYRKHGQDVLNVLAEADYAAGVVCEKASIDESYLDVTDAAMVRMQQHKHPWADTGTLPVGIDEIHIGCKEKLEKGMDAVIGSREWFCRPEGEWCAAELLLAHGAAMVAEKRARVFSKLGYTVSAGVAHTKLLAKLCSGLNKPNMQTVVPQSSVTALLHDLPLEKLRGLGGGKGDRVQACLGVRTVGELAKIPLAQLRRELGEEQGLWLSKMACGHDGESVAPRLAPKSIGCGKTFRDRLLITSLDTDMHMQAQHWLGQLANEMHVRLQEDHEEHCRRATRLVLSIGCATWPVTTIPQRTKAKTTRRPAGSYKSIGAHITRHTADTISSLAIQLFRGWAATAGQGWAVSGLSLSASSFSDAAAGSADLRSLFSAKQTPSKPTLAKQDRDNTSAPADQLQQHQQEKNPRCASEPEAAERDVLATSHVASHDQHAAATTQVQGGREVCMRTAAQQSKVGERGQASEFVSLKAVDRCTSSAVAEIDFTNKPQDVRDHEHSLPFDKLTEPTLSAAALSNGVAGMADACVPGDFPPRDGRASTSAPQAVACEAERGCRTAGYSRDYNNPHTADQHHAAAREREFRAASEDVVLDDLDACAPVLSCGPERTDWTQALVPEAGGKVRPETSSAAHTSNYTFADGSVLHRVGTSMLASSGVVDRCGDAELDVAGVHGEADVGRALERGVATVAECQGVRGLVDSGIAGNAQQEGEGSIIEPPATCAPLRDCGNLADCSPRQNAAAGNFTMHASNACRFSGEGVSVGVKLKEIDVHASHASRSNQKEKETGADTCSNPRGWVTSSTYDHMPGHVSAVALAALPADIRSEIYLAQGVGGGMSGGRPLSTLRSDVQPRKKAAKLSGGRNSGSSTAQQHPQKGIKSFFSGGGKGAKR